MVDFLVANSIYSETEFPYTSGAAGVVKTCDVTGKTEIDRSSKLQLAGTHYAVAYFSDKNARADFLKGLEDQPLIAGIEATNAFISYKSGVFVPEADCGSYGYKNHSVLAVGFGWAAGV